MVKRMIFTKMSYSEKKNLAEKIQNDKLDENTIMAIISTLKENVPELYDILIHKRNQYMVHKLVQLKKKGFENIVIVIGAGHMPGMIELLKQRYRDDEELKNSNATYMNFVVEN
jgi:pheromone shutdown protein TraB